MTDRSHLVRTPIIDVTGKQTAVYRRPAARTAGRKAPLPAPVAGTPATAEPAGEETYAERRARIAEGNRLWREGKHPRFEVMRAEAMDAMPSVLRATMGRGSSSRTYGARVADLIGTGDFAAIVATENLVDAVALQGRRREPEFDFSEILESEGRGRGDGDHRIWTLDMVQALQAMDLMPLYEAPAPEDVLTDPRLKAHVLGTGRGWLDHGSDKEVALLLDEHAQDPEKVLLIGQMAFDLRDRTAIRAAVEGAIPLADGAL